MIKKTMEGKDLINYTAVSKHLNYSPKCIRRGVLLRDKEDQKAVQELERLCEKWAKKYWK